MGVTRRHGVNAAETPDGRDHVVVDESWRLPEQIAARRSQEQTPLPNAKSWDHLKGVQVRLKLGDHTAVARCGELALCGPALPRGRHKLTFITTDSACRGR